MKYIAVFDVPDGWTPDIWNTGAKASFKDPNEYYHVAAVSLKPLPDRIPTEWNTREAAGFNACLDRIEEKG